MHKYIYGNANPVIYKDPTGLFSLAEHSAASSIRNILAGIQTEVGGYLISATLQAIQGGEYTLTNFITELSLNGILAVAPVLFSYAASRLRNASIRALGSSRILTSACGSSFLAGTEILTREGEESIEQIQVGDLVIADDPTTPGEIEARPVVQTFVREVPSVIDIYVDGEIITTTDEHPFWVPDRGWVKAEDLQVGTLLQTATEQTVSIGQIKQREGNFKVYNFEVEDFHTYFVSELALLVHNACNYDVIIETMDATGYITSGYTMTIDDALDTAGVFLRSGYRIVDTQRDVYRSADGLRQFRMDPSSLAGLHAPGVPHVHFEMFSTSTSTVTTINNHVEIVGSI